MAEIIKGKFPKPRKPGNTMIKSATPVAVKVTLNHCNPPIWRHILVPGHLTLFKLQPR